MRRTSWLIATTIAGVVLVVSAHAHVEPPGCSSSGVGLLVSMYRGDGKQGLIGPVSECEHVVYRVSLMRADPSTCAVSGGRLTLTTPDGVVHTLQDPVPCIGPDAGTGPCAIGTASFKSTPLPYAIRATDVADGVVTATARYEGGMIHDSSVDTPGLAVSSQRHADFLSCSDDDPSTLDACDPNAPGAAACSHPAALPVPTSPCLFTPVDADAALVCAPPGCGP